MKPYDKLTIVRNRQRARDLRIFRDVVDVYFERVEYDDEDLPLDWEGAQAARSQINRMLPRMIQVVEATGLGASPSHGTDPGLGIGNVEALRQIFSSRQAQRGGQDILDVLDMALGIYEDTRYAALARTFNPLHYAGTALAYVARLPRNIARALGFRLPRRPLARRGDEAGRLEAIASRLADAADSIEVRFDEMREQQAQQLAQNTAMLTELAERLDFAERVLAQQRPANRLPPPEEKRVVTPV